MLVQIVLLLLGLALVVFGADYLVEGASAIARRFGLSEFVIGLTIVGMGTSAPEMVVSFIGAAQGNADIAMGNVIGSNIWNTLMILGLTAVLLPMPITSQNKHRDIPVNIVVTLLLVVLGLWGSGLSRRDGAILLLVFGLYMYRSFTAPGEQPQEGEEIKSLKPTWAALMILGGLAGLIAGGHFFVNAATAIAKGLGVSDKFIAVTILAGGTSMPELATCVAAAIKKKGQLALGNIIGSNLFNVLLILGGSALIHPLTLVGINAVDLGILLVSAVALWASCYVGKKNMVDRLDGALFLCIWAGYMAYLVVNL